MSRLQPKPETHTLSNGIPVIFQKTDGPVAASYWWIRTGSCDEDKPEAGFAHFLEHMLFKDAAAKETGKASTGKMARAIESLGGDVNAYTSFDQTVYHVTCAAHHWEKVLDAWGEIAKPQEFLKSDFDREREVILEELRKNEDSPGRQLFQSLFSATFAKHPYGRPVIGFEKTLKAATVSMLERFFKKNYVTGQMGLILVGPFDSDRQKDLLKIAEKRFGAQVRAKKTVTRAPRTVEPELRKSAHLVIREFDVKTPSIAFSFRVPELRHPDIAALEVLANLLGMGELSRLYQRLFYQESLVTEAGAGLFVPADAGMLYLTADFDEASKAEKVSRILFEEVARLREEGPRPEELERVLVNLESERLYATQTADGIAGRLGFLRFVMGDLEFDREYLEELRAVDAARVQAVCAQYLDPLRLAGVLLVPKGKKSEVDLSAIEASAAKFLANGQKAAAGKSLKKGRGAKQFAAHPLEPRPEILKRPSGVTVIYRERPQSHVASAHAVVLGGLRMELAAPISTAEKDWGASHLLALGWSKGCGHGLGTKDARQIASIVEGSAASLEGFSGRNTIGLSLTGLSRDWKKLSGLMGEVLVEPTFLPEELEHSKRIVEDSIRGIEDHSAQLCTKLFLETLYEKHPYGKLTLGSLDSVKGMTSETLKGFHQRWVRPQNLFLSVVGSVPRAELEEWVSGVEARLERRAGSTGYQRPEVRPEAALRAPRWVEKRLGREQVHIIVGNQGMTLFDEDRHALRLLQNILGGQSGRLFIELREKKSLAYTVAPMAFEGIEPGYVATYIACSPQKREEALGGIRAVLEKLAAKGPTEQEMNRAREYHLGQRAMGLQSDSAIASSYGLEAVYGLPVHTQEEIVERVSAVTMKDVQRVCRKYFVEPAQVTAVVG